MHSKEHLAFNASAQAYGYDVRKLEAQTGKVIDTAASVISTVMKPFGFTKEMISLTGTCALEHFTSTIAEELLSNPDIQSMFMDETMYHLWMWHAVEKMSIKPWHSMFMKPCMVKELKRILCVL
jgi:predicted metal-dependent hydrolase